MGKGVARQSVTLFVTSLRPLDPLVDALARRGVVPEYPPAGGPTAWHVSFELAAPKAGKKVAPKVARPAGPKPGPEERLAAMLKAVGSLTGEAAAIWAKCGFRRFTIDASCPAKARVLTVFLPDKLLRRAGAVGASVEVTLYPPSVPRTPKPTAVAKPVKPATGSRR